MTDEQQAPDLVMWVGTKFYPTIDSYVVEAMNLGCSKRVPTLPSDVVPGKSRVFLAHDEGVKGHGRIFGFFVLSGIEVIIDDQQKIQQYEQQYSNLHIQTVTTGQAAVEPARLCGQRHPGAFYFVSGQDTQLAFDAAEQLSDKADVKGNLVILMQQIDYPRLRFRGWRYMEPEFLAKYDWPQKTLPVKRTVKVEPKETQQKALPLFGGNR